MDKIYSNFLWGAATSSHQIEGFNYESDWFKWEKEGKTEDRIGSGFTSSHFISYKKDILIAASLGLNSYRFSIEWSKVEPSEGFFDDTSFHWYVELIKICEDEGLMPMITLHHFTSPFWFIKSGGFLNPTSHIKFLNFLSQVLVRIGSNIPLWCTFNEPLVYVLGGCLGGFMPPGFFSPKSAATISYQIFKCHILSYRYIHMNIKKRTGPWKNRPLEVGIAHNMIDFVPYSRINLMDNVMVLLIDRYYNKSWLDAINGKRQHFGLLGFLPYSKSLIRYNYKCTTDFIGINYYTKAYIKFLKKENKQTINTERLKFSLLFSKKGDVSSDLGWAIHPKGLYRVIKKAAKYRKPLYITENGISDKSENLGAVFLRDHIMEIAKSIKNGVNIKGYYYWSLIDNYEWTKGFWPRFGLLKINYDSFERQPKKISLFYKSLIKAHASIRCLKPNKNIIIYAYNKFKSS
jgi:beta-glucosidase